MLAGMNAILAKVLGLGEASPKLESITNKLDKAGYTCWQELEAAFKVLQGPAMLAKLENTGIDAGKAALIVAAAGEALAGRWCIALVQAALQTRPAMLTLGCRPCFACDTDVWTAGQHQGERALCRCVGGAALRQHACGTAWVGQLVH